MFILGGDFILPTFFVNKIILGHCDTRSVLFTIACYLAYYINMRSFYFKPNHLKNQRLETINVYYFL